MHHSKKKNKEQKIKFHAFKHVFSKFIFNKKFHAFIYAFVKNNKTKKIKFYAFINVFLKKIYQKDKKNSCIQACIFIHKIHKILRIHKCILLKKKEQYQKEKRINVLKHAFSFKFKIQI